MLENENPSSQEEKDEIDRILAEIGMLDENTEQIAVLLESVPPQFRESIWNQTPKSLHAKIFLSLPPATRQYFVEIIPIEQLKEILQSYEAHELIDVSESLPEELLMDAVRSLGERERQLYNKADQYDESCIGHHMDHLYLSAPINAKVDYAKKLIGRNMDLETDYIYLVDRTGRLSTSVSVAKTLTALPHQLLADLAESSTDRINANTNIADATLYFSQQDRGSLAVVDEEGYLLGRIGAKRVIQLQRDYYEDINLSSGGLTQEEDLFAPVLVSLKGRTLWLGINLLTALLASWTIGLFESTLSEIVALAVLMPIVASMGGIAGSQTITLIIRAVALDQISQSNAKNLILKELRVGIISGALWSVLIALLVYAWFGSVGLSIIIGLAIFANLIIAPVAGFYIPIFLNKAKIDPALSGSVILTTVTDIVGFFIFLGLGSLFLH